MNSINADHEAIFNRFADGIASESDEQHLVELLRSSAETRRAYREFMALHSTLHWDYVAALSPETPPHRSAPGALIEVRIRRPRWARPVLMAMALLLLIAVGWFAVTRPAANESVAVLKVTDECRWDSEPLSVGDPLGAGQTLRMKTGVAQIEFACGATVVLQGPATFQLDSARQAHLHKGTLSAHIPLPAVGFTIDAPGLKVVDLGTRFGLKTTADGKTEVHVFQGQVEASLVDVQGESLQTVTLNKSEGATIEIVKLTLTPSEAARDQFMFDDALQREVGGLIVPAINGGSSWEGWTLQGVSNQVGIYGSGSTDDVYNVYTALFTFDSHAVSGNPVGSVGFASGTHSVGSFTNGHTILGIGIERKSGSPIAVPTIKFDLGNDSYAAASFVGGEDGKTNISTANAGDFNTQFNYGNTWRTETLAVFDGLGDFDELTGRLVAYDYAFRVFAIRDANTNQTSSYQLFYDLDAMKSLYGAGNPGVGIGSFGSELTIAINGLGSNHAVIEKLPIVPRRQQPPGGDETFNTNGAE